MNYGWIQYAQNCMWLIAPILLLNALFTRRLPRAYQLDVVWHEIPMWVKAGENITRMMVFALPLLMRLKVGTFSQKTGLVLYLIGAISYAASWGMQIWYPRSSWSTSGCGFLAPSYTPLLWLVGIAWIGDSLFVSAPYSPWVYVTLSLAFLAFHSLHAWIVYGRSY